MQRSVGRSGGFSFGKETSIRVRESYAPLLFRCRDAEASVVAVAGFVIDLADARTGPPWAVYVTETPMVSRSLGGSVLLAWPDPGEWASWEALGAEPRHLDSALRALRSFVSYGLWVEASRIPSLMADEGLFGFTDSFCEVLETLARDGAPLEVAVSSAARL